MARPVYPYEMSDPDFAWLLETFQENNPGYRAVQETCLPIVLIAESQRLGSPIVENTSEFVESDPIAELLLGGSDSKGQLDDNG